MADLQVSRSILKKPNTSVSQPILYTVAAGSYAGTAHGAGAPQIASLAAFQKNGALGFVNADGATVLAKTKSLVYTNGQAGGQLLKKCDFLVEVSLDLSTGTLPAAFVGTDELRIRANLPIPADKDANTRVVGEAVDLDGAQTTISARVLKDGTVALFIADVGLVPLTGATAVPAIAIAADTILKIVISGSYIIA
jgi:hypothetical protein